MNFPMRRAAFGMHSITQPSPHLPYYSHCAMATAAAITYASVAPANTLWGPVSWRGSTSLPPRCALTFDDGPSPQSTPQILDILAAQKVPAAFFIVGKNASDSPDIVRRIHDDGHLLPNHSYDLSHFGKMHTQPFWH